MKLLFVLSFVFFCHILQAQVGIGTTSPINKLHIIGDTASPLNSGNTQNSLLRLSNSNSIQTIDFGTSKDGYAWIQSRSSSSYATSFPFLLNPNGGNVGIGTESPSEKLYVNGSIGSTGPIRSSSSGQLLNSIFLNESDLGISNNITNSSTTETTIVSYTYTPVSSSSKIYIEFDCRATIGGSGADELASHISVGGNKIQSNTIEFTNGQGGGGRANTLFPIMGYYNNTGTSNLTINISVQRVNSDDTTTVNPDLSLIIQEVAQ